MKTNVLIGERMCSWMRAHEWEKETLNDQWTKWTNERTNDRSVCTFDWEKCWNNFDIAYSSLIWRKKSRIYECIEFGIGDVDVITSCTENENVLNRMLGWSTPIVEKRRYFTKPEVNVQLRNNNYAHVSKSCATNEKMTKSSNKELDCTQSRGKPRVTWGIRHKKKRRGKVPVHELRWKKKKICTEKKRFSYLPI